MGRGVGERGGKGGEEERGGTWGGSSSRYLFAVAFLYFILFLF